MVSAVLVVCVFMLINFQLYHASNGVFEKAVKAHKEVVYCLSVIRDGKLNASIVIYQSANPRAKNSVWWV